MLFLVVLVVIEVPAVEFVHVSAHVHSHQATSTLPNWDLMTLTLLNRTVSDRLRWLLLVAADLIGQLIQI